MPNDASDPWKIVLSILFFPTFFQQRLVETLVSGEGSFWLTWLKRIYFLLPGLVFLLACWATSAGLITVLIRQKRLEFISRLLITWWDFARAILAMWGGTFKFFIVFFGALLGFLRLMGLAIASLFQDIVMIPIRLARGLGSRAMQPGVPWLAVALTLIWTLIEAGVFTYVTTPLVSDTLSNLTGAGISQKFLRIPLFAFLFFIVLGSYAVLRSWTDALNARNWGALIKIGIIELMVIFVEVMFLYREFVDALIPWFTQYAAKGFEPGLVMILSIAVFSWIGVRGISWFLFASHGAPVLMAIIQGTGLTLSKAAQNRNSEAFASTFTNLAAIKNDMNWVMQKGEEVLDAFVLPPLQVIAAGVNFITLILVSRHLFDMPLNTLRDLTDSKNLLKNLVKDEK